MSEFSVYFSPEPVEVIESVRGFWDGRGWVGNSENALHYPARTRRAQSARRIVEDQTGQRCWVVSHRPEFAQSGR